MFIPLLKVDAVQRMVYGSFDETPDHAREICDYATAKTAFQQWSDGMQKASGGKSFGNIRGQHNPKIAAGLLKSIEFDDTAKRIDFCAKIVDDQEWQKVEEGVYTGFSPGGSYAKRWADGQYHRYTPKVGELSIVDVPCNPNAGFTMVKADGSEAEIEFVIAKAYEPGNEATKDRAADLAKAAGKEGRGKDFVVQARAELIAENATAELAKMAGAEPDVEPAAEPIDDRAAALDAALAKADAVLGAEPSDEAPSRLSTIAAAFTGTTLAKAATDLPFALPSDAAVKLIGADLQKSIAAVALIGATAKPLAKGLYSVSDVASSLNSFSWIARDVCDEARWEGDTESKLPQQAVDIVNSLKTFLIALIEEEVAEMLEQTKADLTDVIDVVIVDDADLVVMELANQIVDLVKGDAALMEKAGARNSKNDSKRIQSIHDEACGLGAACADASADKAVQLAADNDRLTKSVDAALPRLERLSKAFELQSAEMTKMAAEIETLKAQPVLGKGAVFAVDKEQDTGGTAPAAAPSTLEQIKAIPDAAERSRAMEKFAVNVRHTNPGIAG